MKEEKKKEAAVAAQEPAPVYTAEELAQVSDRVFETSPEIVIAALRVAGVKSATIAEAGKIIKEFANKEVK